MSLPFDIFRWAKLNTDSNNFQIKISANEVLEADEFFMDYLLSFFTENDDQIITREQIIITLKSDPDCNPQNILKYLD
jgi:DNA-binding response OmpR family regulator